jgi:hypothetical protein
MSNLRDAWLRDGYVIVRGLCTAERVAWLRTTCDRILGQWRLSSAETGEPGDAEAVSMRHLNHPGYFAGAPDGQREMLSAISDRKVLDLCRELFDAEPLFRCTSLFMNPMTTTQDGNWHRDTQFLYTDESVEQEKILSANGISNHIQLQIALVPSDDIEVVPGSHRRWDTDEEYYVRRTDDGAHSRSPLPSAIRVALEPGDAVGFNAYGLHRGRYHADRLRRTFMLTFTDCRHPLSDYFSKQPWFHSPGYLDGLEDDARQFFDSFVSAYAKDWK